MLSVMSTLTIIVTNWRVWFCKSVFLLPICDEKVSHFLHPLLHIRENHCVTNKSRSQLTDSTPQLAIPKAAALLTATLQQLIP